MTDPAPDPDLEPLAIQERSAATTRAAHSLRIAVSNQYLASFRGVVDQPDGTLLFEVNRNGVDWLLTAEEALAAAAFAAHDKHAVAGYRKVSYRRGMLLSEAPHDTSPGRAVDD